MGIVEDFGRDLEGRAAWRRAQEREPEVCEAFADLAEEVGLRQADGPRSEAGAVKRAIATERGRRVIGDFRDALVQAQDEVAVELRGELFSRERRPPLHLEEPEVEAAEAIAELEGGETRVSPEILGGLTAAHGRALSRSSDPEDSAAGGEAPSKPAPPPPPPPVESGPPPFSPLRRTGGWRSL